MAVDDPNFITQFFNMIGLNTVDDMGTTIRTFNLRDPTADDQYNRLGSISQWITSDQARYTGLSAIVGVVGTALIPVVSKNRYSFGLGGLGGAIVGYLLFDSVKAVVDKVDDFDPIEYILSIPSRIGGWLLNGVRTVLHDLFSFIPGVDKPRELSDTQTEAVARGQGYADVAASGVGYTRSR